MTVERLDITEIVGDLALACEARRHQGDEPAEWVLWTIKCCERRVDRGLICNADLRHFLTTDRAIVCDLCGSRTQPARLDIVRFEAIDRPAT